MAFGKLREARVRGREEGIEIGEERMIQGMRKAGIAEADIQRAITMGDADSNGKSQS